MKKVLFCLFGLVLSAMVLASCSSNGATNTIHFAYLNSDKTVKSNMYIASVDQQNHPYFSSTGKCLTHLDEKGKLDDKCYAYNASLQDITIAPAETITLEYYGITQSYTNETSVNKKLCFDGITRVKGNPMSKYNDVIYFAQYELR